MNYATFPLKSASRERDSFVNATLDTGPAAVPYLIKAIRAQNSSLQRSSWYAKFRYFSVWALGQTRAPEARSAIPRHLNDPVWEIREQARRALEEIAFYEKQKN